MIGDCLCFVSYAWSGKFSKSAEYFVTEWSRFNHGEKQKYISGESQSPLKQYLIKTDEQKKWIKFKKQSKSLYNYCLSIDQGKSLTVMVK